MLDANITDGDPDKTAANMLRAVSARFDAMSGDVRDAYMERARRTLPPSYHNDRNIILATALELYIHDESVKGTLV